MKPLAAVLHNIQAQLDECDAEWCVFGSAARQLAGERVAPNDIDIMMSLDGERKAESLLAEWRTSVQLPESGKWTSRRSHYRMEGIDIDISGGLMRRTPDGWKPVRPSEVHVKDGIRYATNLVDI